MSTQEKIEYLTAKYIESMRDYIKNPTNTIFDNMAYYQQVLFDTLKDDVEVNG